jgi:RNA 3'-terminal phosphate cyclase
MIEIDGSQGALGGVSAFVTCEPTLHFTTNIDVIRAFTGVRIAVEDQGSRHVVTVKR